MPVQMIWAQARDGVIGDGADMPWYLPEDLAYFKSATSGSACVMGRATWESIPPRFRPLPGRRNIVCTRNPDWRAEGAERAASVIEAVALTDGHCMITGGGQVYAAALPLASACLVTEIDAAAQGRVRAPALGPEWALAEAGEWIEDPRSRVDGVEGPIRHRHTLWLRSESRAGLSGGC